MNGSDISSTSVSMTSIQHSIILLLLIIFHCCLLECFILKLCWSLFVVAVDNGNKQSLSHGLWLPPTTTCNSIYISGCDLIVERAMIFIKSEFLCYCFALSLNSRRLVGCTVVVPRNYTGCNSLVVHVKHYGLGMRTT